MPRVPEYQQNVSLRPIHQSGIDVRATPDHFGAAIGRGMGQAAQGMGNLAGSLRAVQEMDDSLRAKEAEDLLAEWDRNAKYGEGGFMTLEGRNAVDGRSAYEEAFDRKRKELGAGLTPGAARMYDRASRARQQSSYEQAIKHSAIARKQWFNDASSARLDTFAEDALAGYGDNATVEKNIAAGQAEIRQQAAMLGWDADTLKNREVEYISSVRLNVALRMMDDDPIAAKKYYEDNKKQFTGPHQMKFDEAVKIPLLNENVKRNTAKFLDDAADPGGYFKAIRSAESGGNDFAKNPRSSATGRYQFTSGTWRGLMRKHPGLGLTVDGRSDPAQQERAIRVFTEENRKVLASSGIKITNGTLYAAHFLGSAGAVSVLQGNPDGLVSDYVSNDVIRANPFLRGMSVSQFAAWANRKAGGDSGEVVSAGGGAAPSSYNRIEGFLSNISDPNERDLTRKAIYAQIEAQNKAAKAQQEAYQAQAFNLIETQNVSPFSLPADVTKAIGMQGMSELMTYWEKRAKGLEPKTDDQLFYDMRTLYATDPKAFAQENLLKYKNLLSPEDYKTAEGWRQTALTDERKAREDGLNLTTAFSQASTMLESVGLTTTGKDGAKNDTLILSIWKATRSSLGTVQNISARSPGGLMPDTPI